MHNVLSNSTDVPTASTVRVYRTELEEDIIISMVDACPWWMLYVYRSPSGDREVCLRIPLASVAVLALIPDLCISKADMGALGGYFAMRALLSRRVSKEEAY